MLQYSGVGVHSIFWISHMLWIISINAIEKGWAGSDGD